MTEQGILFLRHGQTDWNVKNLCVGQVDIPLNDLGWKQASEAARSPLLTKVTGIVSSPLLRARQTAEIVGHVVGMEITFLDDLKECALGELEGLPEHDEAMLAPWLAGATPVGAESWVDFSERVQRAFRHCVEICDRPLIVAHSGVLWAALNNLGLERGEEIANGTITRLPSDFKS